MVETNQESSSKAFFSQRAADVCYTLLFDPGLKHDRGKAQTESFLYRGLSTVRIYTEH